MAKFTVYTDKHSEFRWKFTASNNVVVAKSGESYIKQEDCLASLNLLQKDIGGAPVGYQLRKGVLPTTAVTAPSTVAHTAGTVHLPGSASPAAEASPPIHAEPTPAAPKMTAERFVNPAN